MCFFSSTGRMVSLALAVLCVFSLAIGCSPAGDQPLDPDAAGSADSAAERPAWDGGSLVIIGGGSRPLYVMEKIVELAGGPDCRMMVIPMASADPADTGEYQSGQLREAGAKEIHMRVSCPPHRHPCYYGIDFQAKGELIAAQKSVEELREFLCLDSLHYLSLKGMLDSTGVDFPENNFCKACFDGCYPVEFDEDLSKDCLEAF